jgi:hypothetical protein
MIGDILNAILGECRAFLADTNTDNPADIGTVILKTDFKSDKLATYSMPLLLLDMLDGPESRQFLGGGTSMDWVFALNSYNHSPDAYADDAINTGYSADLLDIIDDIREHFSFGVWITEAMTGIEDNYGFRFTMGGIHKADLLQGDGVVMGWRIVFDSMAVDQVTDLVEPSTEALSNVVQVGSIQVSEEIAGFQEIINLQINMLSQQQAIPANTLINAISLQPFSGTPTVRIGITDGGNEIMDDTVISGFIRITPAYFCGADTILYITQTLNNGIVNMRVDVSKNYFNFQPS